MATHTNLTPDMKAALALEIVFVIFLVAGIGQALASGTTDIYVSASLIFVVPYLVLFYFGWKRKAMAYLGAAVLSAILIIVIPFTIEQGMSDFLLWNTMFATVLFSLMSLEGFKSYLQSKAAS